MTPTLIFAHIPKAAGMTMRHIVARQFVGQPMYMFNQVNSYRIEPLLDLPQSKRDALRCINGHVRFGVHCYLNQPCQYVTFIRDPLDHLISFYFFFNKNRNSELSIEENFEKYLQRSVSQSRQLDWIVGYDTEPDPETGIIDNTRHHLLPVEEKLAIAERNLRQFFPVIGLVEHFDESLLMMRRKLGWPNVYYVRQHYNPDRPRGMDTIRLQEMINEYAKPDLAFYELVKKIYAEQCHDYGPGLEQDVRVFHRNNRIYGRVFSASASLRQSKLYRKFRLILSRVKS